MNSKKLLYSAFLFFYIIFGVVLPINAQQTHVVLNKNDDGPGSLRAVIELANPYDTIGFDAMVDSVKLTSEQLLIDKSLTIVGHLEKTLILRDTLATGSAFRIFDINGNGSPIRVMLNKLDIRNGLTNDSEVFVEAGGGIRILNDTDTLQLLLSNIQYNLTGSGYGFKGTTMVHGGNGGGIFNNGYLIMENCSVSNNTTGNGRNGYGMSYDGGNGGGIYNSGVAEIRECVIKSNKTGYGGVNVDTNKDPVYGWKIRGYTGNGGSGAGICNTGMLKMSRCDISRNQAGRGGRGTDSYHGSGVGGDGGNGGALYNASGASCLFKLSQISENSAGNGGEGRAKYYGTGGDGGFGGATYNEGSLIQINCLIAGNSSGQGGTAYSSLSESIRGTTGSGGGIYHSMGHCEIISSTICNNYMNLDTTNVGEEKGGGIFQVDGDLRISNSIVANNYKVWSLINNDSEGDFTADYSLIESVISGTVEGDAILTGIDAGFINNDDNYRLLESSPCVDAGDPDTTNYVFLPTDLDFLPRIANGRIDMGAYEHQGIVLPEIAVDQTAVDFANVPVQSSRTDTILLINMGTALLYIDSITASKGYFIKYKNNGFEECIKNIDFPGFQSENLIIQFTPEEAKEYPGQILIYSNDPVNPLLTVSVNGEGYIANISDPDLLNLVEVYPVPSTDIVRMMHVAVVEDVTIYDSNGQLVEVYSIDGDSNKLLMDIRSYSEGIYYIRITRNKSSKVLKIIKI